MLKNHLAATLIASVCVVSAVSAPAAAAECLDGGTWAAPDAQGAVPTSGSLALTRARQSDFVLLGEAHDNPDHHLWQLQSLGMLFGSRSDLVIGMEMFPRRVQPVLDRWIAGELSESEFLEQSDWNQVWRFDPDLYLPLLRFARLNRIPLIALNVERGLITDIGMRGLTAIDPARREGITDPAPASDGYRDMLKSSFDLHGMPDEAMFENFVEAQLVWDRAFAQGLADARVAHSSALVVGIIGSGHLQYGFGVPHQLRAMGHENVTVWLPVSQTVSCSELTRIADAVFVIEDAARTPSPRLGVFLLDDEDGATVREVLPDSVADRAGLAGGDRVVTAAGLPVQTSDDIIAIVRRQSPGTWLPLTISRNGETLELVAKFPAPGTANQE